MSSSTAVAKLRGARLESEVDRARSECEWARVAELMPSIRARGSSLAHAADLLQAEIILENFTHSHAPAARPGCVQSGELDSCESMLREAIREPKLDDGGKLEAQLLWARLLYYKAEFDKALKVMEDSRMVTAPFNSIRQLKLVAEAYAIKGYIYRSLDRRANEAEQQQRQRESSQRATHCFEKAAELELEKMGRSGSRPRSTANTSSLSSTTNSVRGERDVPRQPDKLGELLESVLERAPRLRLHDALSHPDASVEAIEWYRRLLTLLGDKLVAARLVARLAARLAELLIVGLPAAELLAPQNSAEKSQHSSHPLTNLVAPPTASQAVHAKQMSSATTDAGTANQLFCPVSRAEEQQLTLALAAALSLRDVPLNRTDEFAAERTAALAQLKRCLYRLTLSMGALHAWSSLASAFERVVLMANAEPTLWRQWALAVAATGQAPQLARRILRLEEELTEHSGDKEIKKNERKQSSVEAAPEKEPDPVEQLLLVRLSLEADDTTAALTHAERALKSCQKSPQLYAHLVARAHAVKALCEWESVDESSTEWSTRCAAWKRASAHAEKAVELDPYDTFALFLSAFLHAIARDTVRAREQAARALELDSEQPQCVALLSLLLTAGGDMTAALELVDGGLDVHPTHHLLRLIRLHILTHFGRTEEMLDEASDLLLEMRRRNERLLAEHQVQNQPLVNASTVAKLTVGRPTSLPPVTPLMLNPISGSTVYSAITPMDESGSTFGGAPPSEKTTTTNAAALSRPAVASTVSGSAELLASSADAAGTTRRGRRAAKNEESGGGGEGGEKSRSYTAATATIWTAVAELLTREGRLGDVAACVEHVAAHYPLTHLPVYLHARVLLARANSGQLTDDQAARVLVQARCALLGALAIAPSDDRSLLALADCYQAERNLALAESTLRELLKVTPDSAFAWHQLGLVLAARGPEHTAQALHCLETALSLQPCTPLLPYTILAPAQAIFGRADGAAE